MRMSLALLILCHIDTNDGATPKESRLHLAILLRLALAFESGVTGSVISNEYSKETLICTEGVLRRFLRL
jgi:hypothetical protein